MKLIVEYTADESAPLKHVATVGCECKPKKYRYGAQDVRTIAPMVMMQIGSMMMEGCKCDAS